MNLSIWYLAIKKYMERLVLETLENNISVGKSIFDKLIWGLTTFLFSSFLLFDLNVWISYILLGISVAIFLLNAFKNRGVVTFSFDRYHAHVLLFAGFCIISSLWARSPSDAVTKGITVIEILVCMSMLYMYYQTQTSLRGLIMALKWASFITTIYTFAFYGWNNITLVLSQGERLAGDFANINSIAMLSAIGLVVVCYQWLYEGFSLTFLLAVPSIVIVAASGSRKALVLAFIGILLIILLRFSTKNILSNALKIIAVVIGALLVFRLISELSMFSGIMDRMDGLFALITGEGDVDSSAYKRDMFMRIAFSQILENPVLGIGMDNAKYVIGEQAGVVVYSHNNFAELICNGGIVGFLIYYSMHIYYLRNLIKYRYLGGSITKLCIALAIVMLIMDWGMISYYSKAQYFYLMIFFLQVKNIKREAVNVQSGMTICSEL